MKNKSKSLPPPSEADRALVDKLRAADRRRIEAARCTLPLYSVKVSGGSFGFPFPALNHEFARKAVYQVTSEIPPIASATLYQVGYFHIDTGKVDSLKKPLIITEGSINE